MKFVDMKLPKPTKKDHQDKCCVSPSTGEAYPWGLKLSFDDERVIEKLPVIKTLKTGEYVTVTARCCVTRTEKEDRKGDDGKIKERISASIQIEQISIDKDNAEKEAFDEAAGKKG